MAYRRTRRYTSTDSLVAVPVDAAATTAAQRHDFGAPVRSWTMATQQAVARMYRYALIFFVVALVASVVFVLMFSHHGIRFWCGLVAIIGYPCAIGFVLYGSGWKRRADHLHLFEHGMVVEARNGPVVPLRYATAQVSERGKTEDARAAAQGRVSAVYAIQDGGSSYRVPDTPWTLAAIEAIQRAMTGDRVAALGHRLDAGESVAFGPVALTGQGFVDKHGDLTGYHQITQISLHQGTWSVQTTGRNSSGLFGELTDGRSFLEILRTRTGLPIDD